MSDASYFSTPWPAFVHQDTTYDLSHLDERQVEVLDSQKVVRRIAVTFSDHCFTREPLPSDDPALRYYPSSRRCGHFCFERYAHSLDLPSYIEQAISRNVWIVRDGGFAIVPVVDHRGVRTLYGVVFSLDRVTGLPVHLHMRVETAYPCDLREINTFGLVKFSVLVYLRMQGKSPKRNFDRNRKRPRAD